MSAIEILIKCDKEIFQMLKGHHILHHYENLKHASGQQYLNQD